MVPVGGGYLLPTKVLPKMESGDMDPREVCALGILQDGSQILGIILPLCEILEK